MLSIWMVLTAIIVLGFSGLPAYLFSPRSMTGQRTATTLMVIGSLLGLGGIAVALGETSRPALQMAWFLPWGQFSVAIDSLSLVFLMPVLIVPTLGSIYGLGYWKQTENLGNGRRLGAAFGVLAGAMAMVVIARDGVLFLIAWELMALAAYFSATAEDDNPDVRRAGWIYFVATHLGTLCLFALFALWRHASGSFALDAMPTLQAEMAGAIYVLTLLGFGLKAGLMPLHMWLPPAHANAPSHVSAVMSGVMLKMGIYGIVRMTALLPTPSVWWGGVLLSAGAISGVAGIAFAIGQHDLKRMLAYSSIENIGIIAMGLGLALLGRSLNQPVWVVLGLSAALLHVWNHSLFKSLLFLNAGAIIHATHTRDMDKMGGLAKSMPRTMGLFVVGAVAICALPPLNGFASEWLLYGGLFQTLGLGGDPGFPAAALAAVALALIGALAVACFVKVLAIVFLGSPRGDSGGHVHEAPASMIVPMVVLAAGCGLIGLFPNLATPLLDNAVRTWARLPEPLPSIATAAPLPWVTSLGLLLVILAGVIVLGVKAVTRTQVITQAGTWGCAYAQPSPRMQYTGSSFGRTLVQLFSFVLLPKYSWPAIQGIFSRKAAFTSGVPDLVLDRLLLPLFGLSARVLPRMRAFFLQQGQAQLYVLYILMIMIVLLVWSALGVQL